MKKVLITGGVGFVGSSLANRLLQNYIVYIIDDLSMGNVNNLNKSKNIYFVQGSVTDKNLMTKLIKENNFEYIFHLAAIASVADSVERPLDTHKVNFDSVLMLLELCREYQKNLKRLVFSSSAAVYGDEETLPKKEESVIRPLTPYAIDKFSAEQYVLDYYSLYGIPTSAVRFFNVYGPNQNSSSPYSGVISIIVDNFKKIKEGKIAHFTIYGDGEQSRDFVYIEDVLDALIIVATSDNSLGTQYNVGTGTGTTLNCLIDTVSSILKINLPIIYEESRAGDIKESLADITKLGKIGFNPKFDIVTGMNDYLKAKFQ
ncbi:NAD-dependent epimerase/dehydratase family protein [Enterococcus sp. 22-H-5-01]|uniref:NAD-dependent epimerase/dehydratase family protein n=1 Tax=Enterococcus sp. 22-H-5-01 TaxID=3418555 RepID=UPI003CFFD17D